jgi:polyhydroxybutyrate depolymerase
MKRKGRVILIFGILMFLALILIVGGPSPRCLFPDEDVPSEGLSARNLLSEGQNRCYHLYLPPDRDKDHPSPLLISLHGFGSKPEAQAWLTRWNELAGEQGYLVAYPQGTSFPLRWNAFSRGSPDDIQFVKDLILDISSFAAVDRSRIFVVGMSNGGAMAHQIGCQMADQIAAIGVVAGPNVDLPGGCQPSRPVPVIAFYGTADPVVSYEGGTVPVQVYSNGGNDIELVSYPGAEAWARGWAQLNRCSDRPWLSHPSVDTISFRYIGCASGTEVILYSVQKGGHTWPGGPTIPYLGKTSGGVDASVFMLEFFEKHQLESTFLP